MRLLLRDVAPERRSPTFVSCVAIVLLEEGLGYGLVVLFPAYGFAALVSHNENLNSPKQGRLNSKEYIRDANALLLLCTTHKTCVDPIRSNTHNIVGVR